MPLELYMSLPEARRVLKVLERADQNGINGLDAVLTHLRCEIEDATPSAPWRQVESYGGVPRNPFERLECGHLYYLRCGIGGAGVMEPHAKKRRCKRCEAEL
ncbi:MAG: hypothetical protein ACR2PW_04660 [Gammaproteobacteria bacterium]